MNKLTDHLKALSQLALCCVVEVRVVDLGVDIVALRCCCCKLISRRLAVHVHGNTTSADVRSLDVRRECPYRGYARDVT